MADVEIRDATVPDVVELALNLRPADLAEMHAYGHHEMVEPLVDNALRSHWCVAARVDGELACVLGVTSLSLLGGVGSPWMMGTPVLERHSRILVRKTPEYIDRMLSVFPHLVNFVHAKNTTSVRWLRRLGFVLEEAQPFGPLGEPFHKFEMRA